MAISVSAVHMAAILKIYELGSMGHFSLTTSQFCNEMSRGVQRIILKFSFSRLHGNPLLLLDWLHHILTNAINDIALAMAAILDFLPAMLRLELIIPLRFFSFKTWVYIPNLSFHNKYKKRYSILGYSNRQLAVMAAILNKKNLALGYLGTLYQVFCGHLKTFPKNFSFLHFFQVEP